MSNPVNPVWFVICAVFGMAIGIVLVILYKRGYVDGETIHGASSVMEAIPVDKSSVFGLILQYSKTAVQTVEQMVKNGEISRDDKTRKQAALRIVENAMLVDGIKCGSEEMYAANNCIEAEVHLLPRNQAKIKPPDDGDGTGADAAADVKEPEGVPEIETAEPEVIPEPEGETAEADADAEQDPEPEESEGPEDDPAA